MRMCVSVYMFLVHHKDHFPEKQFYGDLKVVVRVQMLILGGRLDVRPRCKSSQVCTGV